MSLNRFDPPAAPLSQRWPRRMADTVDLLSSAPSATGSPPARKTRTTSGRAYLRSANNGGEHEHPRPDIHRSPALHVLHRRGVGWVARIALRQREAEMAWQQRRSRISTASGTRSQPRALRSERSTVARGRTFFGIRMRADRIWAIFDWDEAGWQSFTSDPGPGDLSGSRVYARSGQFGGVPPRELRVDTHALRPLRIGRAAAAEEFRARNPPARRRAESAPVVRSPSAAHAGGGGVTPLPGRGKVGIEPMPPTGTLTPTPARRTQ